jgi:hypothetical protein
MYKRIQNQYVTFEQFASWEATRGRYMKGYVLGVDMAFSDNIEVLFHTERK